MSITSTEKPTIAVVGATGYTGTFVIPDLVSRGYTPVAIARDADKLAAAKFDAKVIRRHVDMNDPVSLDSAIKGASVVVNLAGPFDATAEPVVEAALRAKVHYIDVSAEQPSTKNLFEKYDAAAKKADILILPSLAFFGGLTELMATALMQGWDSVDLVETLIGFDRWHPTRGTRNTIPKIGSLVYVDGRLVAKTEDFQKKWQIAEPVGLQTAVELPFSETILISRHVKTSRHRNYLTQVAIDDVLNPDTPFPQKADEKGRSGQNFVVEVVVTRGKEERRATTSGRDGYAATAPLIGLSIDCLSKHEFSGSGVKAPGEVFNADSILKSLGADYPYKVTTALANGATK